MSHLRRKLIRALVAGASLLLAVLPVAILTLRLYGAWRLDAAKAHFEELGPLELASYAPPPVRDRSQNAAFWLQRGAELLHLDDSERELLSRRVGKPGEPWSDSELDAMSSMLEVHSRARRLLALAGPFEVSSLGIDYEDPGAFGPWARFPSTSALLAVECDFHRQRGENDAALETLHLLETSAAAYQRESLLLTRIIGYLYERHSVDCLSALLQQIDDPSGLEAVERDLSHLESVRAPLRRVLLREGANFHALSRPEDLFEIKRPALRRLLRLARYDRLVASVRLESWVRFVELADTPLAGLDSATLRALSLPKRPLLFFDESLYPISLYITFPNAEDAARVDQATRSTLLLARLAVGTRRTFLGSGSYPDQVALLPESPYTGETAAYEKLPDGSVEIAFPLAEERFRLQRPVGRQPRLRWRLSP